MKNLCDRKEPHDSHENCDGRKKWAKGYSPKKQSVVSSLIGPSSSSSKEIYLVSLKDSIVKKQNEIAEIQKRISDLESSGW